MSSRSPESNRPKKASHALILSEPKDKLDLALDAELAVVLEVQLRAWLEASSSGQAAPPVPLQSLDDGAWPLSPARC